MKKILFSLSAMVVLLQFSCVAEASPDKYILQEAPVTFMGTTEQTVNDLNQEETTLETKQILPSSEEEQNELHNMEQDVQYSQIKEEQSTDQQENKLEEEQLQEVDENAQKENIQNEDQNVEQEVTEDKQQTISAVNVTEKEQIIALFDKYFDNADLILSDAKIISINGLLLMQKAIYPNTQEIADYEKRFLELNEQQNSEEKERALTYLNKELITSIAEKLQVLDFSTTLSKEEKFQWGRGSYLLKIANIRNLNVASNISPFCKLLLDEKLNVNDCTPQLEKAQKLSEKMKDAVDISALIFDVDKINAENKIRIKIPENEAIVTNPNGIFYEFEVKTKKIDTILDKNYKHTVEIFVLGELVENAKDPNFDNLGDQEKTDILQMLMINEIVAKLNNLANEKKSNRSLTLTDEQSQCLVDLAEAIKLAEEKYPPIVQNSQKLINKIIKNKDIEPIARYDLFQLHQNQERIKHSVQEIKRIKSILFKVCNLFELPTK